MNKFYKFLAWTLLFLFLVGVTINTSTKNTLPAAGSSFLDNLQTFLAEEDAERFNEVFGSAIVSGGIFASGAGLAHSPSALVAYVEGFYVSESGSITFPDDDTIWLAVHKDTTTTPTGNWTRVSGTHYIYDDVSTSQPSAFTGSILLLKVTTASGAVSVVNDLRAIGVGSLVGWKYAAKTAAYTVLGSDQSTMFDVDATSGNLTISLTAVATLGEGFIFAVKKTDSGGNTVTIDPNASETIDGSTTTVLSTQYQSVFLVSTDTEFLILSSPGLADVVDDSSPQLGGNLDTNSNHILIDDAHGIQDENGLEQLTFQTTASAINEFEMTNAAAGSEPQLAVTGGDTDVSINLAPKGAGNLDLLTGVFEANKGADITSASPALSAATGNFVDITGTTTITALGTVKAGTHMWLRFSGVLTLTHNATTLILPSAANLTTAVNDILHVVSLGSGNWRALDYNRADGGPPIVVANSVDGTHIAMGSDAAGDVLYYDGTNYVRLAIGTAAQVLAVNSGATAPEWAARTGQVLQIVNTQTGAVATGTTTTASIDGIPVKTEGDEYMTLAITPAATDNNLLIETVFCFGHTVSGEIVVIALHQDAVTNAIAAMQTSNGAVVNESHCTSFTHYMAAGTTSETTFKIRAGGGSGTITFNGGAAARLLGGVMASSITITEID